jgi:hypothetical protein
MTATVLFARLFDLLFDPAARRKPHDRRKRAASVTRGCGLLALLAVVAGCADGDPAAPTLGATQQALLGPECQVTGQVIATLDPHHAYTHAAVIHFDAPGLTAPVDGGLAPPLDLELLEATGLPDGHWTLEPDGIGWSLYYTGATSVEGRFTLDVGVRHLQGGDRAGGHDAHLRSAAGRAVAAGQLDRPLHAA